MSRENTDWGALGKEEPVVAIACGGTGGHLFPGLAVGRVLVEQGCRVCLMVSRKEVDRVAASWTSGMEMIPMDGAGFQSGSRFASAKGLWKSWRQVRAAFARLKPKAVLGMGGVTSVMPIWVGRGMGAATFLHESNTIPGRANRWLGSRVDEVFVGFSETLVRMKVRKGSVVGTPVRESFFGVEGRGCRMALGLRNEDPVVLVMGGSQGARAINRLFMEALPDLMERAPGIQVIHLTGTADLNEVREFYEGLSHCRSVVRPFLTEMDLAMGAASVVVGRAGASSLAELAAVKCPSILIPYPFASDDHQRRNAEVYAESGAAVALKQSEASVSRLIEVLLPLLLDGGEARQRMREALGGWQYPRAAEEIAERILERVRPGMAFQRLEKELPD